jgi:hypothetical protein
METQKFTTVCNKNTLAIVDRLVKKINNIESRINTIKELYLRKKSTIEEIKEHNYLILKYNKMIAKKTLIKNNDNLKLKEGEYNRYACER